MDSDDTSKQFIQNNLTFNAWCVDTQMQEKTTCEDMKLPTTIHPFISN